MKKIFHYLVIALGGLIVVGVVLVILNPGIRRSVDSIHPGLSGREDLSRVESSLSLGLSRKSSGSGTTSAQFSLGEKIYATVLLKLLERGDHSLSFLWINPEGTVQERYRKDFFSPGGNYRCWSWLELVGEELIPISIGSFGSGRFLGRWKVRVYLDGAFLTGRGFVVG